MELGRDGAGTGVDLGQEVGSSGSSGAAKILSAFLASGIFQ